MGYHSDHVVFDSCEEFKKWIEAVVASHAEKFGYAKEVATGNRKLYEVTA